MERDTDHTCSHTHAPPGEEQVIRCEVGELLREDASDRARMAAMLNLTAFVKRTNTDERLTSLRAIALEHAPAMRTSVSHQK